MPNVANHKIFCAFGVYVVNVIDPAAIVVLPLTHAGDAFQGFRQQQLVTLDFTKRLGAAPWDEVILDDVGLEKNGSPKTSSNALQRPYNTAGIDVLSVGPTFPGPHWGGIYVERNLFFAQVRPHLSRWPLHGQAYSYMSSAVWTGGAIRRYHGFHATVTGDAGSTKQLQINGTAVTVDLSDRDQCDDPVLLAGKLGDPSQPPGQRDALTATSKVGDQGAIFLALKNCAALDLRSPKQPPNG